MVSKHPHRRFAVKVFNPKSHAICGMEEEFKYVLEKARGLYRVVIDHPVYNKEKNTVYHYVTVGKAKEKGGEIEFGAKHLLRHGGGEARPAP